MVCKAQTLTTRTDQFANIRMDTPFLNRCPCLRENSSRPMKRLHLPRGPCHRGKQAGPKVVASWESQHNLTEEDLWRHTCRDDDANTRQKQRPPHTAVHVSLQATCHKQKVPKRRTCSLTFPCWSATCARGPSGFSGSTAASPIANTPSIPGTLNRPSIAILPLSFFTPCMSRTRSIGASPVDHTISPKGNERPSPRVHSE